MGLTMIKIIAGTVLLIAAFCAVGYLGLSRLPDAVMYVDSSKQCLFVDIVQGDKWKRISCSEFDPAAPYATEYGGRPE